MIIIKGDSVKLIKIHPLHNQKVKDKLNESGVVDTVSGFKNDECLVKFDSDVGKFGDRRLWIKMKYLEKIK